MTPTPINMTDEYQTRSGKRARVLCLDAAGGFPVVALVHDASCERDVPVAYTVDGRWHAYEESPCDLIPAPKKHKRETWLLHLANPNASPYTYTTSDEAIATWRQFPDSFIGLTDATAVFPEGEGLGAEGGA